MCIYFLFSYDFLYVHDGMDDSAPVINTLTGYELLNNSIASSGNGLFLHFTSDSEVRTRGFKVEYERLGNTIYYYVPYIIPENNIVFVTYSY